MKIVINKDAKINFRKGSAREAYYNRLASYNGKTVEAFAKSVAKDVPSVPGRGKLKGKPEPVKGWLSWFERNGYVTFAD